LAATAIRQREFIIDESTYGTKSIVRMIWIQCLSVRPPRDIGTDVAAAGIVPPGPFTLFVQPPPPTAPRAESPSLLASHFRANLSGPGHGFIRDGDGHLCAAPLSYYVRGRDPGSSAPRTSMPAGPVWLAVGGQLSYFYYPRWQRRVIGVVMVPPVREASIYIIAADACAVLEGLLSADCIEGIQENSPGHSGLFFSIHDLFLSCAYSRIKRRGVL